MHIALANITNGGLSGGCRKYLERICPLLLEDGRISRLDVYVPPSSLESFRACLGDVPRSWPVQDPRCGFAWLKREMRQTRPDIVFIPSARWLDCGEAPTVVMVRNMEPLMLPYGGNRLPEAIKNMGRAWAARGACRKATGVIAVSLFVRDFLLRAWRVPREKVEVIYHGSDGTSTMCRQTPPKMLSGTNAEPFLFTAGSIRPARGLEDAIEALGLLKSRGRSMNLIIAGAPTPESGFYEQRMKNLARRLRLEHHIFWVGHLKDDEMAWCFSRSCAFLMTSRVEACPNIVLEAMQNGALSISADTDPMPEMYASTALFYREGDALHLSQRVEESVVASDDLRRKLQTAARQRAQEFSWTRTAQQTIELLARVVRRKLSRHDTAEETVHSRGT